MSMTKIDDATAASTGRTETVARVSGRLVRGPAGGSRRALYVLSGFVYLQQLARLIGWLFTLRTHAELVLCQTAIRVRSSTRLLGVPTRAREEIYPLVGVRRAGFEQAAGGAFLWMGGGLVVAAAALAGVLGFRGVVGFGGSLLFAALGFIALGLALDVGAYALVQRWAAWSRVRLEIVIDDGRRVLIGGVEHRAAQQFLDELTARLPRPRRE
jgi:hypothetical protein